MKNILIINGPNLNLLGTRETEIYGKMSLQDIENECIEIFKKEGKKLIFFQSNSESEIIDKIHSSKNFDGLIINAGAFTHTSIAIHDALKSVSIPKIEVHISNIYKREEFRQKSLISDIVTGGIFGLGSDGYILAIIAMQKLLQK